jgi:hypothetical protein
MKHVTGCDRIWQNDATKHTNTLQMASVEENQSDVSLINNSRLSMSGNNMYGGLK